MKRWILRIALGLFGLMLLVIVAGAGYEIRGRHLAAREFPPPGKLVDIGGRRIQVDCRGRGEPTVVFQAGLDISGSLSWSAVHDAVAETTRACAYSRAGILWSDPGTGVPSGKGVAEDLHAALKMAGERPPLVLVGHSLGGPYSMIYTKYFGAEVAGLVFVDASHPDQVQRLKPVMPERNSMRLYKVASALAWTGVIRAAPASSKGLPHQPADAARAQAAYAPTSLDAMLEETDALDDVLAEAGTFRQLGNRPLFVLTATAPLSKEALGALKMTPEQGRQLQEIWIELQNDEASWSSQSRHQFVPEAGHYIQFDRPDIVVTAVRRVIENVRATRPVRLR